MKDIINKTLESYDFKGKYLDIEAINKLEIYFKSANLRIDLIKFINEQSVLILKETSAELFEEYIELLRPGGNAYTTRRYAASDDPSVLDERVLNGLKETYNSLGVPIAPTIRALNIMKKIVQKQVSQEAQNIVNLPFDHMINSLSY
ncbi:[pt] phycobilisome core component (ApcF) [Galdieria sulphuraria]|uniref:[pt] phycobilisome core component (ApcF) n=1 Tax=Galdieria sulphuraria TaxID=130081 RepID=M2XYD0_GALSU|nr:[pt] phycobilisome core component (ApcF) [Galdieria sulphuraria]EME28464.1 [pt] phycobilisome core component (ApcF) [Galdieria sulphuraria]|eukprot:XP_005704984.1 [pt] phycobilisome core component (ApcF) [Galdieria sulphuraria]